LAFQVVDDILDFEGSRETLGKQTGTDRGKATFVTTFGPAAARQVAGELAAAAKQALGSFGRRGDALAELADFVYSRKD
ncbi:MAG: polyprenyl synthetase family protein, partial [Candidatus Glassbacteria bacterium]